jgi:osmotically-inducible protein OsmY
VEPASVSGCSVSDAASVDDGETVVDASVKGGFVTLTGTADWQYPARRAEFIAGNVAGVTGIENDIYLTSPMPYAGDSRTRSRRR